MTGVPHCRGRVEPGVSDSSLGRYGSEDGPSDNEVTSLPLSSVRTGHFRPVHFRLGHFRTFISDWKPKEGVDR